MVRGCSIVGLSDVRKRSFLEATVRILMLSRCDSPRCAQVACSLSREPTPRTSRPTSARGVVSRDHTPRSSRLSARSTDAADDAGAPAMCASTLSLAGGDVVSATNEADDETTSSESSDSSASTADDDDDDINAVKPAEHVDVGALATSVEPASAVASSYANTSAIDAASNASAQLADDDDNDAGAFQNFSFKHLEHLEALNETLIAGELGVPVRAAGDGTGVGLHVCYACYTRARARSEWWVGTTTQFDACEREVRT
jgi:hypothetical protein